MIGVTVKLKSELRNTVTDEDGKFKINLPNANSMLFFSFVGYLIKELKITPGIEMTVLLEPDQNNLNVVIVVGYGKQQKSKFTSAISIVNTKDVSNITYSNIGQTLQERAPGLFIWD